MAILLNLVKSRSFHKRGAFTEKPRRPKRSRLWCGTASSALLLELRVSALSPYIWWNVLIGRVFPDAPESIFSRFP